ncbi:MAG TPA: amidohydrolase family protein [Chitinophagaceae bacterium]|jgi:imidazolonepropionase-like amidohydrolase|nr:amidohydrolase family protein [Chitinophagaceae bacterium]
MRKLKILAGLGALLTCSFTQAQVTFPVNGVADPRVGCYAFTNASIVKDGQTTLNNATLVIRDGRITTVGTNAAIPKDAVVVNCSGKYIYPSLIDIYSDYGIPIPQRPTPGGGAGGGGFFAPQQFTSNTKGAYGWNQAIRSEVNAADIFTMDDKAAKPLRDIGFGSVLTHQKDGIARGTGAFVTLASEKENLVIVKDKASAHYSFSKGTSTQSYPGSMMGSVALLRQTYLDAQWYKSRPTKEGVNMTLQAWNDEQSLPQIFDANDKWSDIRADRIGDEFGVQYIIKGGGNEYQRINDIAATKASYILSLNFPQAQEVEDPNDAKYVSLADMKHWELAPTNPAAFEKANIPFALTTADLRDVKQFWTNLRKAIEYGLSESKAFDALTKTPATWLGVYDKVGSLDEGKLANFLITTGPLFNEKTIIVENWVQGEKYGVKQDAWTNVAGTYNLVLNTAGGQMNYTLDVKSSTTANVIGKDTLTGKFSYDGKLVKLSFSTTPSRRAQGQAGQGGFGGFGGRGGASIRLSGVNNGDIWQGNGVDTLGNPLTWTATFIKANEPVDSSRRRPPLRLGKVTYPFGSYGWDSLPHQQNLLIKNASVWTNEKEGVLSNTDVLVKNGKIAQIGKNLSDPSAKVIDGTGQYLSPGIIDEHSHIAAFSINEGAQSVTSEVRIGDNLDPEDINIYRQLSGGVTSSHILHGSANTIGGQTQLIKLRWGVNDEELKFKGADPFIKFALGENVKRTASTQGNTRYPDTRMGVEEVQMDAFSRASDYQKQIKEAEQNNKKKGGDAQMSVRRDLELDALVEIMNSKRFITCHSYVQSEITELMRVAEKFGFKVNTFTHILEGYKVADKMKAHGASASTFSDWWAYKLEVQDAIAYNPAIMVKEGLNVCINSDDAEQARRLNQEAAKSVKYGGLTEEQAFKMVTLNPAKALHVDDKVGSIKVGKDADLVLWSDNPLSVYAKANKTIVDGIVYFDRDRDKELRKQIAAERNRLIQKMIAEGRTNPSSMTPARPSLQLVLHCEDYEHSGGLFEADNIDEINSQNQ